MTAGLKARQRQMESITLRLIESPGRERIDLNHDVGAAAELSIIDQWPVLHLQHQLNLG